MSSRMGVEWPSNRSIIEIVVESNSSRTTVELTSNRSCNHCIRQCCNYDSTELRPFVTYDWNWHVHFYRSRERSHVAVQWKSNRNCNGSLNGLRNGAADSRVLKFRHGTVCFSGATVGALFRTPQLVRVRKTGGSGSRRRFRLRFMSRVETNSLLQ